MKRIKMRDARSPEEGVPVEVCETQEEQAVTTVPLPGNPFRETHTNRLRDQLMNYGGFASGGVVGSGRHDVRLLDNETVVAPSDPSLSTLADIAMAIATATEPSISSTIMDRLAATARNLGRAAAGASRAAHVPTFIDLDRPINIDPAEPGSDTTVTVMINHNGEQVSRPVYGRTDAEIRAVADQAMAAMEEELTEEQRLAQGWRRQYFAKTATALRRETGESQDRLGSVSLRLLRGDPRDMDEMFERTASMFPGMDRLSIVTFWGANTSRVGIILLTGGNVETMIGFKVVDPAIWYYRTLDLSQDEVGRRATAVGLIIGWAVGVANT